MTAELRRDLAKTAAGLVFVILAAFTVEAFGKIAWAIFWALN